MGSHQLERERNWDESMIAACLSLSFKANNVISQKQEEGEERKARSKDLEADQIQLITLIAYEKAIGGGGGFKRMLSWQTACFIFFLFPF